jgi:hypothetical protein
VKRRYVVSRHDVKPGETHWDFMVERGEALATFKLSGPLAAAPVEGTRSFDHRLVYLDYEGEISGGRGAVTIVERGELRDVAADPDAPAWTFSVGDAVFVLEGEGDGVRVKRH